MPMQPGPYAPARAVSMQARIVIIASRNALSLPDFLIVALCQVQLRNVQATTVAAKKGCQASAELSAKCCAACHDYSASAEPCDKVSCTGIDLQAASQRSSLHKLACCLASVLETL